MIRAGGYLVWIGAVLAAGVGAARAEGDGDGPTLRAPTLDLSRQPEPPAKGEEPKIEAKAEPGRPRFGTPQSAWVTVGGGAAYDLKDAADYNLRVAYSVFLVEDVEFSAELNGWYFSQPGDDEAGINPAITFRWHFVNTGKWTVFADVGIGILAATGDVPAGGTSFDFTPRAGVGFTREISEDTGARLQVELSWHHISTGRINGDARNPSRDAPMLFAGIQVPF
jgi:hypothetical protein